MSIHFLKKSIFFRYIIIDILKYVSYNQDTGGEYMDFGKRLIEVRKEHGYTRESLAQSLGISKYTLRNYELGTTEPGHTFLKQISNFFHISIDYLMGITDEREILENFSLNTSEQTVVSKYRNLDKHGKEMVDFTLDKEYERCIEEKQKTDEKSHLTAIAAHNDDDSPEQERLMREDLDEL